MAWTAINNKALLVDPTFQNMSQYGYVIDYKCNWSHDGTTKPPKEKKKKMASTLPIQKASYRAIMAGIYIQEQQPQAKKIL